MSMFLTVKHYFSEPVLVSIFALFASVLDSAFRSSLGPSRQFRIAHQSRCSFRFTQLHLCVSVVLTLVTSVSIGTRHLCVLDAAVRAPQVSSSPSEPCSLSLQLVSLPFEAQGTSSQVSVVLHSNYFTLCYVFLDTPLCIAHFVTFLATSQSLSLLCDLFEIDMLKFDDLLSVLC